jgi:hypothetical protein
MMKQLRSNQETYLLHYPVRGFRSFLYAELKCILPDSKVFVQVRLRLYFLRIDLDYLAKGELFRS